MSGRLDRLAGRVTGAADGRRSLRLAAVLSASLGLNGADTATVSATADNLKHQFGVGDTQIGLLLSIVAVAGALCALPAGTLTDRTRRTRLLAGSVLLWAVATLASGAAASYPWLIGARVLLGVVTATTGPVVASLVGDGFRTADRGRVYGLVLAGDLVGTGIGFLAASLLSSVLSWRYAYWWLVVPTLLLAWLAWRLPEPERGGRHDESARAAPADVAESGAAPRPDAVLRRDPSRRSLYWAARYILRVRTNVVLIVASALGYFFFAGLRSFAVLFATGHYALAKPTASVLIVLIGTGAVAGLFVGGRTADAMRARGYPRARITIPIGCLLTVPVVLAPALVSTSLAVSVPLLMVGAALVGAPNPPLDAARLDIMPAALWGRAESVRTVLRTLGEAAAPTLFGYVAEHAFAGVPAESTRLEYTFLIFLAPLVGAGLLGFVALRTYPRDVATARASTAALAEAAE